MLYPLAAAPTQTLIDFLKDHPAVEPLVGDRVSSFKVDTALSRIQLTMLPGAPSQPGFETYEYQVDCWAPLNVNDDIDQAEELARTVCGAIYDLMGSSGVTVAEPTVRPFNLADPVTSRPRFVCQIAFTISPEVAP